MEKASPSRLELAIANREHWSKQERDPMPPSISLTRRRAALLLAALAASPVVLGAPAMAVPNVAESFVDENIHKSLDILRDKRLSSVQRRDQFEGLLLTLVDVRRIAMFTLGQYRRSASPDDIEAFVAAFKNYATAEYQSYFSKYTNQTLKVTGSTEVKPTDFIVQTQLIDPASNEQPAEVDFRVRTDTGKPVLVDVAYQGIWLSLEQRDQFTAFLGQNNGNVRSLVAHLSDLAVTIGKPN
jgi:phospholipid transport system substrate-binding protein